MNSHEWVVDVCDDIRVYAKRNNLCRLAKLIDSAIEVAKLDIDVSATAAVPCERDDEPIIQSSSSNVVQLYRSSDPKLY